jgi:hypothetical protein
MNGRPMTDDRRRENGPRRPEGTRDHRRQEYVAQRLVYSGGDSTRCRSKGTRLNTSTSVAGGQWSVVRQ